MSRTVDKRPGEQQHPTLGQQLRTHVPQPRQTGFCKALTVAFVRELDADWKRRQSASCLQSSARAQDLWPTLEGSAAGRRREHEVRQGMTARG